MTSHHHNHQGTAPGEYPVLNLNPGAKWSKGLTNGRLDTFVGGHFSDINLSSVLFVHRLDDSEHVKLEVWSAPGLSKPTFEEAMKQTFKPAQKGTTLGPSWTNHWWKVSLKIPAYWSQYQRVQFEFDPGCEAMIFSTDGTPVQGITGGYGGERRVEYIIPLEARKAGHHELVIESTCNGLFGIQGGGISPPDMNRYFTLASADLVVPNLDAWHLLWDFTVLRQITEALPGNTPLQNKALVTANAIINAFDHKDPSTINKCRKIAEDVFGEGWQAKGEKIYEEGMHKDNLVWGIGHCHIDTAWLWPFSATQQKVARSWSTQLDLMERYPEHRFACSSAQQYKWLEQLYPKLFERVKAKILEGKFHPIGGSWVENDANMPSGEGLARQFIFGQRFFQTRFGIRCKTAWLPDSFGLTGALPQLIRLAGMDYFFTQKLSWNNINVFPHNTFNWVGIDGTQVMCHMTPVDTYGAQATPGDVNKGITNHKNIESTDKALLVFGNGDGGGGPLPAMLESLRRIRATTNNARELPPVSMGQSVDEFFETLVHETKSGRALPNWHGELYLEFHRGTYTSHGSIKKGNRKSEILLRDVELLATLASLFKSSESDYVYPQSRINDAWEKVLLNHFHDVLPGSAIGMVYEDAEKGYAQVKKDGNELIEEAFRVIFGFPSSDARTQPVSGNFIGFNTTPFPRRDVVKVPFTGSHAAKLRSKLVQTTKDGKGGYALMDCSAGGPLSSSSGMFADCHPVSVYTNGSDHFVLKNDLVQLTISQGRITSLLDVQLRRELIPEGETGGLVIFDDTPNFWDAWDVEIHHLETRKPLKFDKISVLEEGPLRASLLAQLTYGQSSIVVVISLDAVNGSMRHNARPFVNFEAHVEWHQRHEFLKFEIPLNIHSDVATYETPFGHVQRPTHKNTSWDLAKFEVCGHKFADLSEFGYGVAILSESKYGFSCYGNVLRISLLRAATEPDAEQDQGPHDFAWAVLPHVGHFLESDVPIAAYIYNSPLHVRSVADDVKFHPEPKHRPPFVVSGAHNVILETIKRGDDDDICGPGPKTIVLRLYEAYGGHTNVKLLISGSIGIEKAITTNLLEDDHDDELGFTTAAEEEVAQGYSHHINLSFRRFEVKTVKLTLGSGAKKEGDAKRESWVSV